MLATLAVVLAAAACGAAQVRLDEPVALVPVPRDGVAFLSRQRVTVTRGERTEAFDVALQRRGEELVLVGFSSLGARAFTVIQRGGAMESVETAPGLRLPIHPTRILADVHASGVLRWDDAKGLPPTWRFQHARGGYTVRVDTLSWSRLEHPSSTDSGP
ncbi:MAG: DUF3261 domain-containing protein [Polyangiales bacterium]